MGRVLVAVGVETHQNVFALMDEPLWCVFYLFHHLRDRDERRMLRERLARVDSGILTAQAFNKPELLDDELKSVQRAIKDYDKSPDDKAAELVAIRTRGRSLLERIQRDSVLSPDALVS